MNKAKRILIIDFCNFEDYPIGGYLTFAKNMIFSFGNDIAMVGITTDKHDPVGRWFKKSIGGVWFDFFAFAYYSKAITKHIVPDRLASFLYIRRYKKKILSLRFDNVFIQRPEVLLAVKQFGFPNICYCFAGLENPLAISKYKYAHYLADYFERIFFKSLSKLSVILASGDENAIQEMLIRSKGLISRKSVTQFPSRINTEIFKDVKRDEARQILNLPDSSLIIITTGRLSELKGWKFMIDCFRIYENQKPGSLFYFIGEGEDRLKIEAYIQGKNLVNKIFITGRKTTHEVSLYLNAADLFIMGSYKEGWSTSLIEAIACGTPGCVTDFSSAKEIIVEGLNGYVIDDHNVDAFVEGMKKAIELPRPVYRENVLSFSMDKLKSDMIKIWEIK
jgi:glycosyltransferase involved in cell wall biosynthesis